MRVLVGMRVQVGVGIRVQLQEEEGVRICKAGLGGLGVWPVVGLVLPGPSWPLQAPAEVEKVSTWSGRSAVPRTKGQRSG